MNVSVIIPCYNAERWIADSLRSVAQQTLAPKEIIVIDDGSTDASVEAIRQSGVEVKLLHSDRLNGAGARNVGIEAAVGDWIAYQDADDVWMPNHLETVSRLTPEGDVAYLGNCVTFSDSDPSNWKETPLGWRIQEPTGGLSHHDFIDMYSEKRKFTMPSVVVNRARLREVGQFDANLPRRHDIDMWLRVIAGRTWTLNPEPTVAYRVDSPGSISRKVADAAYYYLKAMGKNRESYAGAAMDRILRQLARSAVSAALTFGTPDDRRRARAAAEEYLTLKDRVVLGLGCLAPGLFSWVHRLRNRKVPAYARLAEASKKG